MCDVTVMDIKTVAKHLATAGMLLFIYVAARNVANLDYVAPDWMNYAILAWLVGAGGFCLWDWGTRAWRWIRRRVGTRASQ